MTFLFPDSVRIVRLLAPSRPFDGTRSAARAPRVGDTGTVVDVLPNEAGFQVESVDDQGATVWLATFVTTELELVERF